MFLYCLVFQETDFVCFETGFDKFNIYDVDVLLSSLLEGNDDGENKGMSDHSRVAEDAQGETQPSKEEAAGGEDQTEYHNNSEDLMMGDSSHTSASEPESILDLETESASVREAFESAADTEETPAEDAHVMHETVEEPLPEDLESENNETKDASTAPEEEITAELDVSEQELVTISEAIPELKTTFGATYDAVVTGEETTMNVTPPEEEEREFVEEPSGDEADFMLPGETPLLSLSQEALTTLSSDDLRQQESPPAAQEHENGNPEEEKDLWSSFADPIFSVVTGGERTARDLSSDEEDDDDDDDDEDEEEEKVKQVLKVTRSFEETAEEENPTSEMPNEPVKIEEILEEPPASSPPNDEEETDDDLEKPPVGHTDEDVGDVTGPEEPWEETSKPTGTSTRLMGMLLQDSSAVSEPQKPDLRSVEEPGEQEEEVFKDPDVGDKNANGESINDVTEEEAENKTDGDKEMDNSEDHQNPHTQRRDSSSPDVELGRNFVPEQRRDHLESNGSQSELAVELSPIPEELLPENLEDPEGEKEEETEHLLEDENALSFSNSNSTDSEEASPGAPSLSSPEPEYSDSVMRLTLLRDHFTEQKMGQIQKLLGLQNLFKVEAMFSDLDTELQATRRTHTGATQDIENALEGILETSQNAILDEIERMLDSQENRPNFDQVLDSSDADEETEMLDDFQELAFMLRQKYSTASDSTPLARELGVVQGWTVSYVGVDNFFFYLTFLKHTLVCNDLQKRPDRD